MKFTVSTKPLSDALDLGVVNANVSKFYKLSEVAQVTATRHALIINLSASQITTEIKLSGLGTEDGEVRRFVSCVLLKQLVHTFDANTTDLEFVDGGIVLYSGKSKFVLPQVSDDDEDSQIARPSIPEYSAPQIALDVAAWKFVKDKQMFAAAMLFVKPVYTMAWIGQSGDIVVGDFDSSLFTLSKRGTLGTTCLLTDTAINMLTAAPEGSRLVKLDNSYLIQIKQDSFELVSEFKPRYETDENLGSYHSDIIIDMINNNKSGGIKVPVPPINKFIGQVDIISTGTDASIVVKVENGNFYLSNASSNYSVQGLNPDDNISEYSLEFNLNQLKSVLNDFDGESVTICPCTNKDEVVGIVVYDSSLSIMIAGVD